MLKEFREFLTKSNALALAIGVIIGAALGKVVSSLVADILMPIIGIVLPKGGWREAKLHLAGSNYILYGDFLGNIVDFLVIALIVFIVTKALIKPAPAPETVTCEFCKEANTKGATRCKYCTSTIG